MKNNPQNRKKQKQKNSRILLKNNELSSKKEMISANIISYFNPEKVLKITNSSKKEYLTTLKNADKAIIPSVQKTVILIFFDKNTSKEILIHDFETSLKNIHNDSVIIVDNIYENPEIKKAWEVIKQHFKITVTIDIYHMGLVFFRKEQEKEHFIIRV